ncbi:hypothetical protein D3C81_906990 [compost metagenome]
MRRIRPNRHPIRSIFIIILSFSLGLISIKVVTEYANPKQQRERELDKYLTSILEEIDKKDKNEAIEIIKIENNKSLKYSIELEDNIDRTLLKIYSNDQYKFVKIVEILN